jgi:hypothetical protein
MRQNRTRKIWVYNKFSLLRFSARFARKKGGMCFRFWALPKIETFFLALKRARRAKKMYSYEFVIHPYTCFRIILLVFNVLVIEVFNTDLHTDLSGNENSLTTLKITLMKRILNTILLIVNSSFLFGQDSSAYLVVVKSDFILDYPETTLEPLNPEIIAALHGTRLEDITEFLDTYRFKIINQLKPNPELLFNTYETESQENLVLGMTKEDSSIVAIQFQTANSALPFLQYFQELGYDLEEKTIGDNPVYLYKDDEMEIMVMENTMFQNTMISISEMPTFDIIKKEYDKSDRKSKESGRWQAFKDIFALKNKEHKTIDDILSPEAALLEDYTFDQLAIFSKSKEAKNINKLIEKNFIKDKSFMKKFQNCMTAACKLANDDKKNLYTNGITRALENYLTFYNLKHVAYFLMFMNEKPKK